MRQSRLENNEVDCSRCCFLLFLTAMGLTLYGAIHFIIIYDEFNNRMDRIAEKYDDAFNATTNSSICEGTLDHLKFNNDRDNCPTNEPCHDYCKNYFDAFIAQFGPLFGIIVFSFAFAIGAGILLLLIVNCRSIHNRPVTYGSMDDVQENPVVIEDGTDYENESISRRPESNDISPEIELPIANRLIPYNPNQQSAESQEQIVSATCTLSCSLPFFTHTGSAHKNQGQENGFIV